MSTLCLPFRKASSTDATSTSFTAKIPVATEPSGVAIHNLLSEALGWGGGVMVPSHLQLVPYCTAANDITFDFRVFGWNKVAGLSIWVPQLLIDVSVVAGNMAGTVILANSFMADTLTVNDGPADNGLWRSIIDCQEDLPASIVIHTRGCQYIEFDFDATGATAMNVLFRPITP